MMITNEAQETTGDICRKMISIITPAFNESKNLPLLYEQLIPSLDTLGMDWEWVIIDDHSEDNTFAVAKELAAHDKRVRGIRLARNLGSHAAIACGIHQVQGDVAVVMAADLQDPPELLSELVREWTQGYHVVWAARRERPGENTSTIHFSRIYFFIMRKVVGIREMPATGSDYFLIDRLVLDGYRRFNEANLNIIALLTWMGFRQKTIFYDKEVRLHGKSGWNLAKKIKIIVDSITSFSYLPIRIMTVMGITISLLGFIYAAVVTWRAITVETPVGWASIMVVVIIIGGMVMLMMGVLGEYVWRALDEARHRPRFLVENDTNPAWRCRPEELDLEQKLNESDKL